MCTGPTPKTATKCILIAMYRNVEILKTIVYVCLQFNNCTDGEGDR